MILFHLEFFLKKLTCVKESIFKGIYHESRNEHTRGEEMDRVLLVDVEMRKQEQLETYLKKENYLCEKAVCVNKALSYIKEENFSLILLDVYLPEMADWNLCEEIRKFSDIPIIFVTACADKEVIVKSFKLGADDYIIRPFDKEVLLARMEAVLRRTKPKKEIDIDGLYWNEDCFKLVYKKKAIKLTPKEFTLLGHLIKHPNQVFSREQLISVLWGYTSVTDERTVDSHVQNIREKIGKAGFPIAAHFKTIWGIGYQWINE